MSYGESLSMAFVQTKTSYWSVSLPTPIKQLRVDCKNAAKQLSLLIQLVWVHSAWKLLKDTKPTDKSKWAYSNVARQNQLLKSLQSWVTLNWVEIWSAFLRSAISESLESAFYIT